MAVSAGGVVSYYSEVCSECGHQETVDREIRSRRVVARHEGHRVPCTKPFIPDPEHPEIERCGGVMIADPNARGMFGI